jgi:hypothetical protein
VKFHPRDLFITKRHQTFDDTPPGPEKDRKAVNATIGGGRGRTG